MGIFQGNWGGMPKNCIDPGWIFPTRKWVVESNDPPVLEKKRRSTWLSRQNVGPWLRENVGPSLARQKLGPKTGRPKGNPTWLIGLHIRPSFRGEGEGTLGGGLVELISHKKRFFSIHGGKKTKKQNLHLSILLVIFLEWLSDLRRGDQKGQIESPGK